MHAPTSSPTTLASLPSLAGRAWRGWLAGLTDTLTRDLRPRRWVTDMGTVRRGQVVALLLPTGSALEKRLVLPATAERHLPALLRHEVGRQFPFPAEACAFGWRVESRGPEGLAVRLAALPVEEAAGIEADLGARGARLSALAVTDAGGGTLVLLDRGGGGVGRPDWLLAGLAIAVLLAAAGLPLWQQAQRLERVRAEASALSALAPAQGQDRRQVLALVERAARSRSVSLLLERVTAALPDEAWVKRLVLDGQGLELEGTAASAAALVPKLEAIPGVASVSFAAPTVLDPALGVERFRFRLVFAEGQP